MMAKLLLALVHQIFKTILTELPTEKVYVLGNFGLNTITPKAGFPTIGTWYDYFTGKEIKITELDEIVELQSGEFHVLTTKKYPNPEANIIPWIYTKQTILSTEKTDDAMIVFPSPSNEKVFIKISPMPGTEIILEKFDGKKITTTHYRQRNAGS